MLAIRRHLELKMSGFSGMGAGCPPMGMVSQNDAGSEENVRSALHENVAFDIVQVRHEVAQVANVGNLRCEEDCWRHDVEILPALEPPRTEDVVMHGRSGCHVNVEQRLPGPPEIDQAIIC